MKVFSTSEKAIHTSCDSSDNEHTPPKRICSTWQDILLSSIYLVIPIAILTVSLVVIVIRYGVKAEVQESPLLSQASPVNVRDDALYVSVDATHLTFLASRISSVATLLIGAGVVLASYPIAQRYLKDSIQRNDRLLTPFQLGLAVKFIEGSPWRALWSLLQYHLDWENHERIWGTPLAHVATVSVVITLLSSLVFGADTWLHFATKTVQLTQFSALANEQVLHSFVPSAACAASNNSLAALDQTSRSCTVPFDPKSTQNRFPLLIDTNTTLEVLNNQSSLISVLQSSDPSMSYLAPAPAALDPMQDFGATSFGVRTQCVPISQACNLTLDQDIYLTFNCSGGTFAAGNTTFADTGAFAKVFKQSDFSDRDDRYKYYGVNNSFFVGAATISSMSPATGLGRDPEVFSWGGNTSVAAVFRCEITILDIEYTRVGALMSVTNTHPSNTSVTNMFINGWKQPSTWGKKNILAAMDMAAIHSKNAQELSDRFGAILRNVILASGAGSLSLVPVNIAQLRQDVLVAEIPKTPFILLIVADVAFIFVGLVLTILAISTPSEGREAQYHLTIAGLVANACDRDNVREQASNVNHLFGEFHAVGDPGRVGYNRTSRNGLVLENFSSRNRTNNTREARQLQGQGNDEQIDGITVSAPLEFGFGEGKPVNDYALYVRDSRDWV